MNGCEYRKIAFETKLLPAVARHRQTNREVLQKICFTSAGRTDPSVAT